MLVVTGGTGADPFVAQTRIEGLLVQFGKLRQQGPRPGLGRQNAPHRGQGEGAEADGSFQRRQHIIPLVLSQQRQ